MTTINPVLQLPDKMDPNLRRALMKAWQDMTNQINPLLSVQVQATQPFLTGGQVTLWVDTVNTKYYLVANFGQGIIKKVELT